jgi:hypothetical protein
VQSKALKPPEQRLRIRLLCPFASGIASDRMAPIGEGEGDKLLYMAKRWRPQVYTMDHVRAMQRHTAAAGFA